MRLSKEQYIYLGIGVFLALVILNSTKSTKVDEVTDASAKKMGFDASRLPKHLQPPKKLGVNEPLPSAKVEKRNFHTLFSGNQGFYL